MAGGAEQGLVVGIDVAKAELEVAVRPSGARWTAANEAGGIRELAARLTALGPTLIVLEATGGYELAVVGALTTAGLPLAVVNPRQVRDFARGHRATGEDGSPGCGAPGGLWGASASAGASGAG